MKTLFCALMLASLSANAARADIVITFDEPDQPAGPGGTLQFFGSIRNTGSATVFLNGDDVNLLGLSFSVNDLFFSNAPVSLNPGESSGDIELFDVTVGKPLSDPTANYAGTYTLLGGLDGGAEDNLGQASFSVTTTPEPSELYFLSGVSALVVLRARKTRRAA